MSPRSGVVGRIGLRAARSRRANSPYTWATLIDQLVRLRHHRGLPATILGARTGIDASAIYAYEHGRRDPRASTTEAWARGLGARVIVVDTHGRASAAVQIQHHLRDGDSNAARQALLQLASTLQVCDILAVAALTIDAPETQDGGWTSAMAGLVDYVTACRSIPTPTWATQTAGDPTARWSPWATELADLVDVGKVPEPLLRRGVLIEAGELESA